MMEIHKNQKVRHDRAPAKETSAVMDTPPLSWSEMSHHVDALMEQYNREKERRSVEGLPKWCE